MNELFMFVCLRSSSKVRGDPLVGHGLNHRHRIVPPQWFTSNSEPKDWRARSCGFHGNGPEGIQTLRRRCSPKRKSTTAAQPLPQPATAACSFRGGSFQNTLLWDHRASVRHGSSIAEYRSYFRARVYNMYVQKDPEKVSGVDMMLSTFKVILHRSVDRLLLLALS